MNQVYAEIEGFVPQLRRYALALCHNPTAADDLVQESVARALTKSDLFNTGTNLRAWLFTIMHNVHISNGRRQKYIGMPIDPDIVAAKLSTQPTQEAPLVMKALNKALQVIPDTQRVAVILAGVEGMSYEEISVQLNVGPRIAWPWCTWCVHSAPSITDPRIPRRRRHWPTPSARPDTASPTGFR